MLGSKAGTDTRAVRHSATRERILDAAWRLARRDGIAALSFREVAREVGMQAPSLYTYFPSKNHLYDAMFGQGLQQLAGELERLVPSADPIANLRRRTKRFVLLCAEDPIRYELIFQRPVPGFEPSPETFAIGARGLADTIKVLKNAGIREKRRIDLWRALTTGLIGLQIANDPGGDRWTRLTDDAIDLFITQWTKPVSKKEPSSKKATGRGKK